MCILHPVMNKQKQQTMEKLRTTKLWVVLNERTLRTQIDESTNEVAKFQTEREADEWASNFLEIWTPVKIHFEHKWISHSVEAPQEHL